MSFSDQNLHRTLADIRPRFFSALRNIGTCSTVILILGSSVQCFAQSSKPFLSCLEADAKFPVFTTVCAALQRSEFVLDEGFHFRSSDPEKGADWATDKAGDWCLGFKRGAAFVVTVGSMAETPVITAAYPDLLRYRFRPFPDLEVKATFLAYSSHLAVQDLEIANTGSDTALFRLIPFLAHRSGTFEDLRFQPEQNAVVFSHEELPDGWVVDHNIPYVQNVRDVFAVSLAPDRMTSFRSETWGPVEIPGIVDLARPPVRRLWGRMDHRDGSRCQHRDPGPRLTAWKDNDLGRIVTEKSPLWGRPEPAIDPYGYYRLELGNFGSGLEADSYSIWVVCPQTNTGAMVLDLLSDRGKDVQQRVDAILDTLKTGLVVKNLRRGVWGSGTEIRLYWDGLGPGIRYNVYRRDYRKGGVYERIAGPMELAFFTDKGLSGDPLYGYVVTALDGWGRMGPASEEVNNITGSDFLTDIRYPDQQPTRAEDMARVIALEKSVSLEPGRTLHMRVFRGFGRDETDIEKRFSEIESLTSASLDTFLRADEELFSLIPTLDSSDPETESLYWNAFSMMRQVMLPPEGKCGRPYYVFSREPAWGWGHGGQVFHESLSMLAYALLDPAGAMESQRVYRDRQHKDGYINYRTGPYLDETIETGGEKTTSAPWYAWQNWEVYRITRDRIFLAEMYGSSRRFYERVVRTRDKDHDGLCEWGGDAVLESVRDGLVAVWDEVAPPDSLEALDLNTFLVSEARALEAMAAELGRNKEARHWKEEADRRASRINETFWDEKTGFYYHVGRRVHDFSFRKPDDLKRMEVIGFLPLWAGIADSSRAERLIRHLSNPEKFWRPYGVPSLAADDPYYEAKGYWNGPVWVPWNYLVFRGLVRYGRFDLAREMTRRLSRAIIWCLKTDHDFWEFTSPDELWGGYHRTYIWTGLIARMLLDTKNLPAPVEGLR